MKKGIVSVISALVGGIAGVAAAGRIFCRQAENYKSMAEKHLALFLLMNRWVQIRQEERSIANYLLESGYKKVAIYGMSYVGETLIRELKDSEIQVLYGIDQNADTIYSDIELKKPQDRLPEADAVIVTAITYYDEIEEILQEKMNCPIISLEEIFDEIEV